MMIRIMHVMDKLSVDGSNIQGPARQIAYRLRYYDPDKYRVMMVNLRGDGPAADLLRERGAEVVSLGRGKFDVRALGDLRRLVRQWRPDVLHLHSYAAWTFGRVVGRMAGLPVVAQEHFVEEAVPRVQRVADRALRRWQDRVLAVSSGVRRFVAEQRFIDGPIEVILNGVPVEDFQAPSAGRLAALRAELGFEDGQPVVGTVGRLAEMKGHGHFLDAAAQVHRVRPETRFVVLGEGPLRGDLEAQAKELGIAEAVRFVGYQAAVLDYLSLFDVSVIASVFGEGFPGVAVETFMAGTPLVISDLPNYRGDLFEDAVNCRMVPPGDAAALAEAVGGLLADPAEAARLVAGATEAVRACDSRRIAGRYLAIYEELVTGRVARGAA